MAFTADFGSVLVSQFHVFLERLADDFLQFRGRLANARTLSQRSFDAALRASRKDVAARWQMGSALREAEFGNRDRARQQALAAVARGAAVYTKVLASLALARAGDSVQAESLSREIDHDAPSDTLVQNVWLPCIRAAIALDHGEPAKVIDLLKPSLADEQAGNVFLLVAPMYPPYLRGQAYILLRQGKEGAAEFQKLIDYPGVVLNFHTAALARLGLARSYVLQGDTAKARAAYQEFLTLWKGADPDIPALQQAKAEYAKVQ